MTGANADLDELLDLATRAAHEAGRLVMRTPNDSLQAATKSSPNAAARHLRGWEATWTGGESA